MGDDFALPQVGESLNTNELEWANKAIACQKNGSDPSKDQNNW